MAGSTSVRHSQTHSSHTLHRTEMLRGSSSIHYHTLYTLYPLFTRMLPRTFTLVTTIFILYLSIARTDIPLEYASFSSILHEACQKP